MPEETIGDWTVDKFVRFIQQVLQENPPSNIPTLVCDNLTVSTEATFNDQLKLNNIQFTVGAAGGASALPATPKGYFRVKDYTGQSFVVPYYNT